MTQPDAHLDGSHARRIAAAVERIAAAAEALRVRNTIFAGAIRQSVADLDTLLLERGPRG